MTVCAAVCIFIAFGFYTSSVFGERKRGLTRLIVLLFISGFAMDCVGTGIMFCIGGEKSANAIIHTIVGLPALIIMGVHALWATAVFFWGRETARQLFRKWSLKAYCLWLLAFISGILVM